MTSSLKERSFVLAASTLSICVNVSDILDPKQCKYCTSFLDNDACSQQSQANAAVAASINAIDEYNAALNVQGRFAIYGLYFQMHELPCWPGKIYICTSLPQLTMRTQHCFLMHIHACTTVCMHSLLLTSDVTIRSLRMAEHAISDCCGSWQDSFWTPTRTSKQFQHRACYSCSMLTVDTQGIQVSPGKKGIVATSGEWSKSIQ